MSEPEVVHEQKSVFFTVKRAMIVGAVVLGVFGALTGDAQWGFERGLRFVIGAAFGTFLYCGLTLTGRLRKKILSARSLVTSSRTPPTEDQPINNLTTEPERRAEMSNTQVSRNISRSLRTKSLRFMAQFASVLAIICGVLSFIGFLGFTAELGFAIAIGSAICSLTVCLSIAVVTDYVAWRTEGSPQ